MRSFGELTDIRTVEWIGWFSLALPVLPIILLLSYAMIAWYQAGHFPSYGDPNPKNMGLGVLYGFVLIFTLLSPWLLLLCCSFAILFLLLAGLQRKTVLRNLVVVILVNTFYFWFMSSDPLGLENWIG